MKLPRDAELTATHRPDLLNGVTVIQGQGLDQNNKPVKLTAIPYHAWANRERGAMTIWIRESARTPGMKP